LEFSVILVRPGCSGSAILYYEYRIVFIDDRVNVFDGDEAEGGCFMNIINLDNLALEIARKHLLKNVSFKDLGQSYYAAPSTIHRRLKKWLDEDRFDIQDKLANRKTAFVTARDDDLGEALARQTGVWRARVVRISGVEQAYTPQYQERPETVNAQAAYKASDDLHRCLGEAAGELILNSLRRNLTIGISSGRGVGFSIEGLGEIVRKTPSWARGYESIRLVSLCGGVHVGKWELSDTNSRDFDADENVFALAGILNIPRNNLSYMTGPISMEARGNQSGTGHNISLDMAVIGLGQLNTQHHYFRDYNELQLKTLSVPIRKIVEWQSRNPELYEGLVEIVLRLYPSGKGALPLEFLETLREVNENILAAAPEKIKNAGEVVLIAGGRQKVDALYGILNGEYPAAPIDKKNLTLVTDSWTAETILQKMSEQRKKQRIG
jgi:DNA-binding transcriptional regulator LsrR (DeoR family)